MDVEDWLRRLGMEQYASAFRDNAIDAEVLLRLTAEDLKDIGVAAVGHRRKLLDAIAAVGAVPSPLEVAVAPAPPPPRAKDEAERRPITVMFCDLVGSTSMAGGMDAEDWRELVGAYLDEAAKAVTQSGGHVLKKLGDGLMALFGYPKAQENDAERAARAGLAILRALEDLNAKNAECGLPALAARIGLQSGPVVVDSSGEVFGDAPNVAARVQAAAEPGTLFVTALVQRQVAGLFVAEDKGPHNLKGVPGTPVLYRLVRASGGGRKIGARSLTPLVGRDEELAALERRWERARAGDGQFVQIVGEPGLGKSRLMDEFRIRLVETPHTWVEWSSSQLLQNTPLHPLAEWGRQRFAGEAKFTELETALAHVKLDPAEHAPLLASLLDISTPDGRAPQLAADELRRRQLMAVVAWLLAGARAQPLVLAFEDLHWADPTTLDLMKTLTDRGGQAPLLIVATARPEFRAPWTTRSHHGVISLSPLDRAQIGQMVGAIAARHAFSKDVVEGLSDRTAGVPLFIEELTRLMLEGGAQTIPPSLQQSLAARLDRLGEAREIAQVGAVLGREFSYALLVVVAGLPQAAVDAALEKLADADLMFVDGITPASTYRFKHALIQDAAYESLLKGRRQALHQRAAEAHLAAPDTQPELVAHHFTQSGQTDLAIEWLGKAGDAALTRSAFQEAISHIGKAVEMIDRGERARSAQMPPGEKASARKVATAAPGADRQSRDLRAKYAQALMITEGFTSEAAQTAYSRIGVDGGGPDLTLERWSILYGQWTHNVVKGDPSAALAVAETQLREGESAKLPAMEAGAHRQISTSLFMLGRFAEARSHAMHARAIYDEPCALQSRAATGGDLLAIVEIYLAITAWWTGNIDAADLHLEMAITRAKLHDPAWTLVLVLSSAFFYLAPARSYAKILEFADTALAVMDDKGIGAWGPFVKLYESWARGRLHDLKSGASDVRAAWDALRQRGMRAYDTLALACVADLEAASGNADLALATIDEGLRICHETGVHWWLTKLHTARGEVLLARDPGAAEASFREALAIARSQGARTMELLAALPLARLLQSSARPVEAHEVLASTVKGFAPTPSLPIIAEAQAMLVDLAASLRIFEEYK